MEYRNSLNKAIANFFKGLKTFVENPVASANLIPGGMISVPMRSLMVIVFLFFGIAAFSQSYRISTFNGQTVTTCSGIFYDSGGAFSDYDNNENYTVTFCSGNGNTVKFDFTSLVIRTLDTLYVYDGPDTSAPLKAKYSNVLTTASLLSSGTCMTFVFVSNGVFTRPGWVANISCCPPPVTSPVLPSDPYQCAGSTLNYSVDLHAGSTYNWTVINGTPASVTGGTNNLNITWDPAGDVTGYVRVVEVNTCGSKDSSQLFVDIYSLPVVDFSGLNPAYCSYTPPVTLTGSPSGGIFSGPGISGNTFTPSLAGLGIHNITYTYTDPSTGCTNLKVHQTSVTLPQVFIVGASSNSYCAGFGVSITLSGSEVNTSYQLQKNGVNDGAPLPGTGSALSWSNKQNGVYTVVATENITLCANNMSGSQTILQNPLPTPTFTAQPGAASCSSVNVTYTTQALRSNYVWGFTGVAGTGYNIISGGGTTDNSVTLVWLTAGSKTVTVNYTDANGCTALTPVSSNPTIVSITPAAPTGAAVQNFCSETSPTVASLSAAGSGILWYAAAGGGAPLPTATALTGNTHYFASQTVTGCESLTRLDVTAMIFSIPLAPAATAGTGATCSQITANWSASAGAASYRLDVSTVNSFASFVAGYQDRNVGNITSFNVTGLTAGVTYYYRLRAVDFCGTSPNSATIVYSTLPAAPATPGAITGTTPQCPAAAGQIYSIAAVLNATTYTWTVPAGWSITGGQGTRIATVTTGSAGQNGNITVTAGNTCGTSAPSTLAVTVIPNASITSVSGSSPICINSTALYSANGVVLSGGTGAWSSSNPAVATVTPAGLVRGISAGACNIIYTITGGCGGTVSALQAVTIPPNASIASVTGSTPLCIGATATYTANGVVFSGGTGAWSSSNSLVATVSATGVVTGISAGTSDIIYSITGGCGGVVSAQQSVTVFPNASITSVTGTSPLCTGASSAFTANGVVLSGGTGTWSSSNPAVATVSVAGMVTAVSAGTCNIIYTITGGCGGTVSALRAVTVNPNSSITSVTGASPLCIGSASVYIANGVVLSGGTGAWSSSNPAVATVTPAGLVTGITAGTCDIIYTITGGCAGTVSAQRTVTINPNAVVTSVTGISPICIGGTTTYTANGVVMSGGAGAWSSSNAAVATVTPAGLVTGISAGTCNIIYTITGGCGGTVSAQQSVNINPNASIISVTGLSPLCIGGTTSYTANGVVLSGGTGAWSSSNPAVATVNAAGLVTGISAGVSNIIFTITGGCGGTVSAQRAVTINPDASITSVTGTSPLCLGATATYTANGVVLSGGAGAWSSSNPAVATVSAAGLVTGVAVGTCNIIYTITGGCNATVSAQQSVTVNPGAAITSVTGASPLCIGGTATYTANGVVTGGGTGAWSSSNAAVATISAAGLVTGVSAGTCNIIYTITGGCGGTVSAQKSITINPNAAITSVSGISPLCIGGTAAYTANGVVLSGGTGAWSSSNAAVATVTPAGLVTGISAGICNIIYTITGGCGATVSAQRSVTINPNAAITSVTGTTPLCIAGSATFTANGVLLGGGTGTWSSSNAAVATVTPAGLVTGISAGTCNIIYTITGGCGGIVSAQQVVNINPNAGITSITGLSPLCIGGTTTFTANGVILSGGAGAWSSSNPAVATVNAAGLVTAVSAGLCNIIYTITGGCGGTVSAQRAVTINPNAGITSVTGASPICVGGTSPFTANGVVLSGGTGAWSSSNPAVATVSAAGLVTGVSVGISNIIYTITGGCGATVSAQQSVTVNPGAAITSVTGATPLCIAGTATYTANGVVTGGGTGAWSSSNSSVATVSAAGLVTGVSAGTCNIIYTITGGCGSTVSAQQSVTINPNAAITSVTGLSPLCIGGTATYTSNGVVLSGGTGAWSSSNAAVATVSPAGLVTGVTAGTCNIIYTITGGCGGSVSAQRSLNVNPNAAITSVTGATPLCIAATTTYTANGVVSGGGIGTWSSSNAAVATVSAAGLVTGVSAGTCNIIYTIAGGCGGVVSALQTVTVSPNAAITTVTGTASLCIGGTTPYTANGVVLSGGTGAWSSSNPAVATVSPAGSVTGVLAGTCDIIYTITGGCGGITSARQSVTINPNAGIISVTGSSPLCIGGTAIFTANGVVLGGGTGAWSSSNATIASVSVAGVVTPVSAGICNIIYTISGGCGGVVSASALLTVSVAPAATISYSGSPWCSTAGVQSVTRTGTPGGTYSAMPAGLSIDASTGDLTPGTSSAGTYTVTYTMSSIVCGNITTNTIVTINPIPSVVINNPAAVCFPSSVDITLPAITSGSEPGLIFTYWTDPGGTVAFGTPSAALTGTYYIKGTAGTGCFNIKPVTVVVNPLPSVTGTQTNILCTGALTGSIDITVSAGNPPYTFAWTGSGVAPASEDQTGLAAGLYSVVVSDASGCSSVSATFTITEPVSALAAMAVVTGTPCSGNPTGSIDLTALGGTAPYTFLWSNGDTGEDLNNIPAGVYTVTITDGAGCTAASGATVEELTGTAAAIDIRCNGTADGSVDITVSGGLAPITFLWSNGATTEDISGLAAGSYTVTISDAGGCSLNVTATIAEPAILDAVLTASNILCAGTPTGSVDQTVSGGSTPYAFNWDNGATTEDIANIVAGNYSVTITDARGCTFSGTTTVTEPAQPLTGNITSQIDITCEGAADGSVTVTGAGGTLPYEYSLENGTFQPSGTFSGLDAAMYTITVRDANLCTFDLMPVLTQPAAITINPTKTNATCPDAADGSITISIAGGRPPYAIIWYDEDDHTTKTGLLPGTYRVTVTDTSGCSALSDIVIEHSRNEGCLEIQTIITPNDDGYNDTWILKNIDLYPDAEVFVYNRWGEQVFHTKNMLANPWDGTSNGKQLPTDSYHYILNLHNGMEPKAGVISIIK